MSVFERAWKCLLRKPMKSILLFLMVWMISLFLLSAMASGTANIEIQDKTRQAIGAGILLETNETNRYQRIEEISKKIGEDREGTLDGVHQKRMDTIYGVQWQVWTDNSFETLQENDIKKIAEVSGICDYNITTAITAVNPVNFSRIEAEDTDQSREIQGVSLIGNRDMQMDSNVLSGNLFLKDGRMIGRNDMDVCVISEELAVKNNLTIGDILEFNDYHNREDAAVYKAEIIGIYSVYQSMTPYMAGDTFRSENVIFTDLGFPKKAEGESEALYEKAYFKIENVDAYDTVKENIRKLDIDWARYDLIDNNGNYETVSGNFNHLEIISKLLILIILAVSFMILFLIFIFWLKNRVQEVGIFLAIGISKMEIIGQILLEAILITSTALVISFLFAPSVSKLAANYLVERQEQDSQNEKDLEQGKVAFDFEESQREITAVSVNITTKMMLFDAMVIFVLINGSVTMAAFVMLRKNPRAILSQIN